MTPLALDEIDRRIVNALQGGFPVCPRPYARAASELGLCEDDLIARIGRLLAAGLLSRFGPMYRAERLGGALTLCAMAVPAERFDEVAAIVNALREVAHNYQRDHELNMWFVIAASSRADIERVIADIAARTGLEVFDFPKQREFFVELKVEA